MRRNSLILAVCLICAGTLVTRPKTLASASSPSISRSLSLHASFDKGLDADFARGDRVLYHSASAKRADPKPGLPKNVLVAKGKGKRGDALHFVEKGSAALFFRADKNIAYARENWSGAVSFWLKVDPETELAPGYTDPIQITERAWNDAAIWADFSDKSPRHFRMGAFADLKVWNPTGKDYEKMTPEERPMFDSGKPPFSSTTWSHVAITFERFNTGRKDGRAVLFIDGKKRGEVSGRDQTFTWDPSKAAIMIGLSYKGLFDELSIFDRALNESEIRALYESTASPTAE